MDRLIDFAGNHPLLVSAALAMAAVVAFNEWRIRGRGRTDVTPVDAVRLINAGAVVLDARTRDQFDAGHIINARSLPMDQLESKLDGLRKKYQSKTVITCCDNGSRSGQMAARLRKEGLPQVLNLRGGLQAWRTDNLPVESKGK